MSDGAYIVRPVMAFDREFTRLPNEWVRDTNLSWDTAGLLTWLMSQQTGWSTSIKRLAQERGTGRAVIDRMVHELKENHYLRHDLQRGNHGRIAATLWVLTDPAEVARKSRSQPQLDLPARGSTGTRLNRLPDNQLLIEANPQEDLSKELKTLSSTGAGIDMDALTRAAVKSLPPRVETPLERYTRLVHEKCPATASAVHDFRFGPCGWCGAPKPKPYDSTEEAMA